MLQEKVTQINKLINVEPKSEEKKIDKFLSFKKDIIHVEEKLTIKPTDWVETFCTINIRTPFRFKSTYTTEDGRDVLHDRSYLFPIYNNENKRLLLKTGRQCVCLDQPLMLANGKIINFGDSKVEDKVLCYDTEKNETTTSEIDYVWKPIEKECVEIETRQGHIIKCSTDHPIRQFEKYTKAGELKVGDVVAVVRKGGIFENLNVKDERIILTAYMIGDGSTVCSTANYDYSFTVDKRNLLVLNEFIKMAGEKNVKLFLRKNSNGIKININKCKIYKWFKNDNLHGKYSYEKEIPDWVFKLNKEKTALFINRLWSTDGHVKKIHSKNYDIEYCSSSYKLIQQLNSLLLKFSIPCGIRKFYPSYRKNGEKIYTRPSWILSVETREGCIKFLTEIGALGKSENIEIIDGYERNQYDTLPIEINYKILEMYKNNKNKKYTFNSKKITYPHTTRSFNRFILERYIKMFKEDNTYKKDDIKYLEKYLKKDIYWDRIKKIKNIGQQLCTDISVNIFENFNIDSITVHNCEKSTLLSNKIMIQACMRADPRQILFVAPREKQMQKFSNQRIKPLYEFNDKISQYWHDPRLVNQVGEKMTTTGSTMNFGYAFLTADALRGLSIQDLFVDEIQDQLTDNIIVIEETTSHYLDTATYTYSGTPKSIDGTLEQYWNLSTQNEWEVYCHHCGYMQILDDKNLGPEFLICKKCQKDIDAKWGHWVSMYPQKDWISYRIPQVMVPWVPYSEILAKKKRYPISKFLNEVMAMPAEATERLFTISMLKNSCNPEYTNFFEMYDRNKMPLPIFAGIDIGRAEGDYPSFTVLTIISKTAQDRTTLLYTKKFMFGQETDPHYQIQFIIQKCKQFNVTFIGVDWGDSFVFAEALRNAFSTRQVIKFFYHTPISAKLKWDAKAYKFIVNRTTAMADLRNEIANGHWEFPCWNLFEPFAEDMLCILTDRYSNDSIKYDHPINKPDDFYHSLVYAHLAQDIYYNKRHHL